MIFTLLTFLSAFTVAGVAGWFSIAGITSIYAGAPLHAALVMGTVLEGAKLVTISWLYRNWDHASWKLKAPMVYFIVALMTATSVGVFGFLTKAHLEQGAATIDNTAKVERLDQQIAREKSVIADNEKIISQLDAAITSFIGKDRADRALSVRKSQAPQRLQLRNDITAAQKQIDLYSDDKFKLTSEVRALQLEVGPIRYIAELFYSASGDETKNVETAVKLFTLLIVSTLDPLAVVLLIAANHTLLRRKNEKETIAAWTEDIEDIAAPQPEEVLEEESQHASGSPDFEVDDSASANTDPDTNIQAEYTTAPAGAESPEIAEIAVAQVQVPEVDDEIPGEEVETVDEAVTLDVIESIPELEIISGTAPTTVKSPAPSRVAFNTHDIDKIANAPELSWDEQSAVLRELRGSQLHFMPKPLDNVVNNQHTEEDLDLEAINKALDLNEPRYDSSTGKYPSTLSWLTEFKRD